MSRQAKKAGFFKMTKKIPFDRLRKGNFFLPRICRLAPLFSHKQFCFYSF
jgi:hypothetical protein